MSEAKRPWDKPEREMTEEDWLALEADTLKRYGTEEASRFEYNELTKGMVVPDDFLD